MTTLEIVTLLSYLAHHLRERGNAAEAAAADAGRKDRYGSASFYRGLATGYASSVTEVLDVVSSLDHPRKEAVQANER